MTEAATTTRQLLFAVIAATATTRWVAYGLSRNTIRTHLPASPSTPASTTESRRSNRRPLEQATDGNNSNLNADWNVATPLDRKQAMRSLSSAILAGVFASTVAPSASNAFDRSFPNELTDVDQTDNTNSGVLIGKRSNAQQRKQQAQETKTKMDQNLASFTPKKDFLPSLTWGLALFFASGSRSNPLATPLANLLYKPEEEKWLQDRNAGLFAALPWEFLIILGMVFLALGTLTQYTFLQLSDGDSGVCGQLAGVALINGGFFEIGRIASGEKGLTRDENDREVQLEQEFDEFATQRLKAGGNCHRSDIVKSFRRYFAKYRQADGEQYPLTDREIEMLLKRWNQQKNMGKAEMSSSGFYYGIQINTDADVFV